MAIEYYAGTSGRVKAIKITPDLTTDEVAYAGTTLTMAEIQSWEINWSQESPPESITFESEADAEGHLYPEIHRGGIARWSGTLTALVNGDTTDSFAALPSGCFFIADMLFHKSSSDGFANLKCKMTGRPVKTGVQEKMATFTMNFVGSGALAAPIL